MIKSSKSVNMSVADNLFSFHCCMNKTYMKKIKQHKVNPASYILSYKVDMYYVLKTEYDRVTHCHQLI